MRSRIPHKVRTTIRSRILSHMAVRPLTSHTAGAGAHDDRHILQFYAILTERQIAVRKRSFRMILYGGGMGPMGYGTIGGGVGTTRVNPTYTQDTRLCGNGFNAAASSTRCSSY